MDQVFYKSSRDMAEVPDAAVALIVTSPPYWDIKDYSGNAAPDPADCGAIADYDAYLDALDAVWRECVRVLRPNGKLAVNAPLLPLPKARSGGRHNRELLNIYADIEQRIKRMPAMRLLDVYVWERTNGSKPVMFGSYPQPGNLYAQNCIEFIGVFVKAGRPPPRDPALPADPLSKTEWLEYTRQVWRLPVPSRADPGYRSHEALMPAAIPQRLIRLYTQPGELVLDPFCGTGTALRAAQQLGRRYAGYELYHRYAPAILAKTGTKPLWGSPPGP